MIAFLESMRDTTHMQQKTIITAGIATMGLVLSLSLFPHPAAAQTLLPTQTTRLSRISALCSSAISMRLSALNTAQTRINGLKKLSSTQKQQYTNEISNDISGLQTVQSQCTTDNTAGNLATLRNDYHSIFTKYRIYAVFLPQLHLLAAVDTMGTTADLLSTFAGQLQTRIQNAGNATNLTGLLQDMQSKITDAQTQYNSVESAIAPLTPDSYNTNPTGTKSTLQTARADIKEGAGDLKNAWADAKQIRSILKSTAVTTPTPTP